MAIFARIMLCVFLLSGIPIALGVAQPSSPAAVRLLHSRRHLLIVFARINGNGPYKFILDTGTNVSLIETSLFRELGLKQVGVPSHKVVGWMALGKLTVADQVSIEHGPSRKAVRLLEVEGIKRPEIGPSVRGVLGENFLSGFDLLIDNRRRQVTFDEGDSVASSVDGEHVALALTSDMDGVKIRDRPTVSASIHSSFGLRDPIQLLLDTGVEGVYLATHNEKSRRFLESSSSCAHRRERLEVGSLITHKVWVTSCANPVEVATDVDGTLPTFIFDRIFISSKRKYLIINPVSKGSVRHLAHSTLQISTPLSQ